MENKTTNGVEKLIAENMRLVPYIIKQLGIDSASYYYDDLIQTGYIGLIKAAETFDSSKAKFITYSCKCIHNEIIMYLRKEQKNKYLVSLEDKCLEGINDNSKLIYAQVIEDKDARFFENVIDYRELEQALSLILNTFSNRERTIMLYSISGISQMDISKKLNLSQSYVSKLLNITRENLKLLMQKRANYKRKYKVEIFKTLVRISSSVNNKRSIDSIIISQIEFLHKTYAFCIKFIEDQIIIEIPIEKLNSFYIISRVIEIIEENN